MTRSKRQQTRDTILSSAWQLFHQQSYAETTTRQIATAAGVATGTVFSHFPSKIDLLKAGVEQQVERVLHEAEASDTAHSPAERLLHYARYLFAYYLEQREFSMELFKELLWQQPQLKPQIIAFQQRLFSHQSAYDPILPQVMMELYFMTLITGLQTPEATADTLLESLRQRLACLQRPQDSQVSLS
ncbi:TetR/AcrR family transcriptional regulator [Photobacterium atrarenae]|uniref:TetR/AcrR family transcriptional regulator n=1 Tax=Photobacterium atrarenae TaxID=865757 RepID=A0ABY5GL21_9GAMM|nr:TetR/AcrR family transcriptional regulator [Photobacterium atrarenae]UTV29424.1 TetR/AcrR family transcriptional regulator [Photobacterium atrarenae]